MFFPPSQFYTNSTNPGYRFVYTQIKQEPLVPDEFDFFNFWCGQDPIAAKEYYKTYMV